jgi:hypothetical protein
MGGYSNWSNERDMEEAYHGPLVSAAPGYFQVDEKWPDSEPEPIIAWRVGSVVVLPVTRMGCRASECYVLCPDGKVRHHGAPAPSDVPDYISLAAWRVGVRDERSTDLTSALDIPF